MEEEAIRILGVGIEPSGIRKGVIVNGDAAQAITRSVEKAEQTSVEITALVSGRGASPISSRGVVGVAGE